VGELERARRRWLGRRVRLEPGLGYDWIVTEVYLAGGRPRLVMLAFPPGAERVTAGTAWPGEVVCTEKGKG
jgi:hypothetical protein